MGKLYSRVKQSKLMRRMLCSSKILFEFMKNSEQRNQITLEIFIQELLKNSDSHLTKFRLSSYFVILIGTFYYSGLNFISGVWWSRWQYKSSMEFRSQKQLASTISCEQSYVIKSSPWTILWFRILGIFSVENINRLGVFMFQN